MTMAEQVVHGAAVSWEHYSCLEEDQRVEYIDGRLVVRPSATRRHQKLITRLVFALEAVAPASHDVAMAWSWKPGPDEFIPDVMVHPVTTDEQRFTGTPALVVEILSTNRSDDLMVKREKYAAAGAAHYWIVDIRGRGSLDAFVLDHNGYRLAQQVSADGPVVAVDLGVAVLPVASSLLR